jgi:DNA-binding GntR family transcriptional regulator
MHGQIKMRGTMTKERKQQTQAEQAYTVLRSRLLSNSLEAGSRLNEYFWAEQLKVNRGDVRQALARLYADGLIAKASKKGFCVKSYTQQDLQYLNETRTVLETAAAHLAVKRATRHDINKLKQTCNLMHKMAQQNYSLALCEADLIFHTQFIDCAHNPKLSDIYGKANIPITALVILSGQSPREKLLFDTSQHLKIAEALEVKNLPTLLTLLSQHLHA